MTTVSHEPVLDDEWLAAPRSRSRLRLALTAMLAASVCFLGGALLQKHMGTDSSASPAAAPGGFPGGAFPGGGTLPGGGQLPGGGNTAVPEQGGGNGDTDAVIGTVLSIDGHVWTVEDLGGTKHKVRVDEDSDLVRETELTADQVAVGDRVDISGTTANGQLRAKDITVR